MLIIEIVFLCIINFAYAQWGCIALCPTCACGNHYHWKEPMSNHKISKSDIDGYLESFRMSGSGEDENRSEHNREHTTMRIAYELAKHLEDENLRKTLDKERKEDREEFAFASHRARSEIMYSYLDWLDEITQIEA